MPLSGISTCNSRRASCARYSPPGACLDCTEQLEEKGLLLAPQRQFRTEHRLQLQAVRLQPLQRLGKALQQALAESAVLQPGQAASGRRRLAAEGLLESQHLIDSRQVRRL